MKIQNTKKSCWSNGHQIRGGSFHTFAASILNFAAMLSFDKKRFFKTLSLEFYKLEQSKN
jgi:hypothetical protein